MKLRLGLWAIAIALAVPGLAAAQGPRAASAPAPVTALQEQKEQNQDQPIQIESATLEVHDKSKMATFSGDVQVVQGDTTIKCQTLVVFYGGGGPGEVRSLPQSRIRLKGGAGHNAKEPGRAARSPGYPQDRSARRRHRHFQGPECQRRSRRLRREEKDHHADWKRRGQSGQERPPRRSGDCRYDDRQCSHRVRRDQSRIVSAR